MCGGYVPRQLKSGRGRKNRLSPQPSTANFPAGFEGAQPLVGMPEGVKPLRKKRGCSKEQGIFGRISKAFFDDLGKKLKPAEE